MGKYVFFYWVFVVVGIVISSAFSSSVHEFIDIPRGVPLARLGMFGAIAQVFLMVFPFLFAPILTGCAYFGFNQCKPSKKEVRRSTAAVAFSTALLLWFFFIVSGAWFGLLQGTLWVIGLVLLGPPLTATVAFRVLFPTSVHVLASRSGA
jgi:hypothetical protein